jgi:hypothetical protein
MDFLKKHYEKILLGVMLLGLIGVLVFMLFYIASDKEQMATRGDTLTKPHVKPLPDLDTNLENTAINRLKSPYSLDFDSTNKLLNPMKWQKAMDGTLIPTDKKTGPQMVTVTAITPLSLIISLDSVINNELGARYVIKVERQAAPTPAKRQPARHYVSVGEKNDSFTLESIKGAPENPDSLQLKLADSNEDVTITKDKPYSRIEAYMADFRYDPERKVFRARRVGDRISFGGADYVVVEVNPNELILMDQSNQKKTSLPFAH